MKGIVFQKPLEFVLEIQGESWTQGQALQGELRIRNHSSNELPIGAVQLLIAYGQTKKVRLKAADAFEHLSELSVISIPEKLGPQKQWVLPWKYQLGINAPITDAGGSLYLLYGKGDLGQLQLNVLPDPVIQEIIQVIEVQLRFVRKSQKFQKGAHKDFIETKFAPPNAKGFALVEQLVLSAKFENEQLKLNYEFQVKSISASAAAVEIKKEKRSFEQLFKNSELKTQSGRFNFEHLEPAVRGIFTQVESKVVF